MRALVWVVIAGLLVPGVGTEARVQTEAMAKTVMAEWPDGSVLTTKSPGQWGYEEGVLLDGMAAEWELTHDPAELAYVKRAVDKYVMADGTIRMNAAGKVFDGAEHQLDWIEPGRAVLFVYRQTHEEKYAKAAKFLHEQLAAQPRNQSGGYWHKTIYPNQMWLDGAYMAEPFRAEYAAVFHEEKDWDDIAKQFLLMWEHMRDPKTGLLKHGWDESKEMAWADKQTGLSPEIWARAVGWYCMGLVDVLDWFPKGNAQRGKLVEVFQKLTASVIQHRGADGLWWQVMDRSSRHTGMIDNDPRIHDDKAWAKLHADDAAWSMGNFPEASASCMFVYALKKGVRMNYLMGYLAESTAQGAWSAIQKEFVRRNEDGTVTLTGTVKAAGLGGKPYRSGTYAYYIGEPTGEQDAKGVGAYLLAGSEMEQMK